MMVNKSCKKNELRYFIWDTANIGENAEYAKMKIQINADLALINGNIYRFAIDRMESKTKPKPKANWRKEGF